MPALDLTFVKDLSKLSGISGSG